MPAARHFTTHAIRDLGGCRRFEEAELLVSELATNAVVHARTPMRVSVLRHGPRIRIEVRDDDPDRPIEVQPDPMALGGRGVYLVHALASAWGVNANNRGKTVWFELQ